MSDNIDYAELDKAVNEAIKSNQTARPAAKPVAKPVVKNTTVPRPHGQFMDFVPRPTNSVPVAHPVARPVLKPAVKTTTTVTRPVNSVARPVAKPVAKPVAAPTHTVARPVAKPVAHPAVHRAVATHPNVAAQIQQRQAKVAAKAAAPVAKPAPKPVAKPAEKPVVKAAEKPVARKSTEEKSPNANNYSLGGRSPFLTDAKVEKRPLGKNIPETSHSALKSTKNTYSQKTPNKTNHAKKHIVTEAPKKHSGWLWALVVLLVIAAGGGLGYLAYILVFAGGF